MFTYCLCLRLNGNEAHAHHSENESLHLHCFRLNVFFLAFLFNIGGPKLNFFGTHDVFQDVPLCITSMLFIVVITFLFATQWTTLHF